VIVAVWLALAVAITLWAAATWGSWGW
jgi:hypothetical protein